MAALSSGWQPTLELRRAAHAVGQKPSNDVGIFRDLLRRVLFPCREKLAVSAIVRLV